MIVVRAVLFAIALNAALAFSAPQTLSETGLYDDIVAKHVREENRPFSPQYPLWSDGATKTRWFYLPPGAVINNGKPDGSASSPHKGNQDYWIFPVGTKFWKEFVLSNRRVETRFSTKVSDDQWEFSSYEWNENESNAFLVDKAGKKSAVHDIPSEGECLTCHNRGGDAVLGFDALQLSWDRDPLAPHAFALAPKEVTLKTLAEEHRLTYSAKEAPIIKSSSPEGRAIQGYLHANCGNCHNPTGTAQYSYLYLRYPVATPSESASPFFESAVNRLAAKLLIPSVTQTFRVKPGDPGASAVLYAMNRGSSLPMPPIGVKETDLDFVNRLETWIRELSP